MIQLLVCSWVYSWWSFPESSMLSVNWILLVCSRGYWKKYPWHVNQGQTTTMWFNCFNTSNERMSRATKNRVPERFERFSKNPNHIQYKYWVIIILINILKSSINSTEFNYSADNTKWGTEDERIATLSFVLLDKNKNKNWERKEWKAFRDLVNTKQLRRCGKRVSLQCH